MNIIFNSPVRNDSESNAMEQEISEGQSKTIS